MTCKTRLGLLAACAMATLPLTGHAQGLHQPNAEAAVAPTPSNMSRLKSPDDVTIGKGGHLLFVFLDRGTPELRRQTIALFAFAQTHPGYTVVIKDLPLLSQESVDIAMAESAVAAQHDPAVWRMFEYQVVLEANPLTPALLRGYALTAGANPEAYDRSLKDGSAASRLAYIRRMASAANIHGAPFFVFDRGTTLQGLQSVVALSAAAG